MGERNLSVVTWDSCDLCGGTGEASDREPCEPCDACEGTGELHGHQRPTPADIAAHLLTLAHDDRVALLRELLRAAPDAAVEAVDACKVARAVGFAATHRRAMNGDTLQKVSPTRPGRSVVPITDAALLADGWVLAGGAR